MLANTKAAPDDPDKPLPRMSIPSASGQMSKTRTKKRTNHHSKALASTPISVSGSKKNDSGSSSKKPSRKDKKDKKKRKKEHGVPSEARHKKPINSQDEASPTPAADVRKTKSSQKDTTPARSTALTVAAESPPSSKKALRSKLRRSPYQMKTLLGTVALLPSSTSNVLQHIQSLLHSLLLTYDSTMGGVLLSLQGDTKGGEGSCVTLLPVSDNGTSLIGGRVINDLPHVHYRFKVEGLLFCPTVGMELRGRVVECTPTYVTLTTHNILSTKISAEQLQGGGFAYDKETLEWTHEKEVSIYLDYTVGFVVEKIYECGGYISLDGRHPSLVSKLS